MLLEDGTSREHTRMSSLGPHVQFFVKLVRTALMCKFSINPRESSLLPVSAYRWGLSLSQQDLVGVCAVLMSVFAGGICVCMFVGWSLLVQYLGIWCCSDKLGCLGCCGRTHNPSSSAAVPCMFLQMGWKFIIAQRYSGGGSWCSSNKMRHFFLWN